ncbi:aldehyde dehydrogenase [Rhodococcus sp. SORGH_AS_0301]|uniref:aldehyde dehydrogenase family protein n=1 Tax=Rhodococcus sp. SORGH_AS_0301 TaxID=3041780 RepID=UPI002783D113|nr:aldehyde dehydrogenase family protein [Rhodococcus sp. SORGH_AS_0301]MDQ1178572.1 aldehyde dehydrogenase (NAD+) [Rhodococcus sp. SORGH_AS_0301]
MTIIKPDITRLPGTGLVIGADRVEDSSGGAVEHRYPGDGSVTGLIPLAGAHEVDAAVRAARAAQPIWERMAPPERRRLLHRLADLIEADSERLTHLTTIDNGTPMMVTAHGAPATAELFRYNAGWTDRLEGSVIPTWPGSNLDYAVEKPYGVVAVIISFNGPLIGCAMTAAPALAAGNTVVIKPSQLTPYSPTRLGELALEAGIPPGVINILVASAQGGTELVKHPGIDKIHFTGSGPTAQRIVTDAVANMTPVGLELGGKSAALVFDDIDVDATVPALLSGLINMSGQGCINATRLMVQDGIYDHVVAAAEKTIEHIPMGDPYDKTTVMGPVINEQACDRILGMIDRATEGGARVVTGGHRMGDDLADGFFLAPTIVADVPNSSYIAQNEVFGPVLSILRFTNETEAVSMANDTEFGLAGYVYTHKLERAHRVADKLQAGNVWINDCTGIPASVPFGGVKGSGFGRLGGKWGVREFTQPKNIWLKL